MTRPVTHAVIAIPPLQAGLLAVAAREAGLTVLEALDPGTKALDHAAREAAILAEDLAPKLV